VRAASDLLGQKLISDRLRGPFRTTPIEKLARVTPAEGFGSIHTWKMGPENNHRFGDGWMNKGFEVIEACWLWFAPSEIEVVVHPQSTVHAMVEYKRRQRDRTSSAPPICGMPIQYALYMARPRARARCRGWTDRGAPLGFRDAGFQRFPLLSLAYHAPRRRAEPLDVRSMPPMR